MIEMEEVSFGYPEEEISLHECSLQVRRGECVLLCGESGCGKTTVTKLINGLIPHYTQGCTWKGKVTAAGLPVAQTQLYVLAEHIGSVFQNPKSQFFNLDTDSELAFGLENQGMEPDKMRRRLDETVRDLQAERLSGRDIFSLSGGEKQMLAFASVYAMNPDIYVLDEPTANLDARAIERLRRQILYLKHIGRTVVIAEHRLYFLADVIDRAVYIRQGRIERSFTGETFCRLSEEERISLGLRTIRQSELRLPPARAEEEGLVVKGLTCGYKKEPPVIEGLSFSVRRGEVLAVTGPNGAGKTTLVRTLSGLMKERSGEVWLDGVRRRAKERQRVSFCVMQDVNHQLFYDSVGHECEQAAGTVDRKSVENGTGKKRGAGSEKDIEKDIGKDIGKDIEKVLEQFDLLALADRHPMALSGGQKQRLAVATALLSGKEVLIFDEPTSGLDYRHMKEVCRVVRALAKEGHIVLVVSHDQEFMQEACDRVLELKGS